MPEPLRGKRHWRWSASRHSPNFGDFGDGFTWVLIAVPGKSTHQVVAAVLPTTDGNLLKIRRATTPETQHRLIYRVLAIPEEVMPPIKTWLPAQEEDLQG